MDNYDENKQKSAPLASLISALIPGSGFMYLGNYTKGFAYILIFISLIVLIVYSAEEGRASMVTEIVLFSLLLAGFYIFQIIDTYNDAQKEKKSSESSDKKEEYQNGSSLFGAIIILVLGVLFQLKNLDIISFRNIIRLWPMILIGIGLKIVLQYYFEKEKKNVKE